MTRRYLVVFDPARTVADPNANPSVFTLGVSDGGVTYSRG